jgi:hypothetical protein
MPEISTVPETMASTPSETSRIGPTSSMPGMLNADTETEAGVYV